MGALHVIVEHSHLDTTGNAARQWHYW